MRLYFSARLELNNIIGSSRLALTNRLSDALATMIAVNPDSQTLKQLPVLEYFRGALEPISGEEFVAACKL